MESTRKDRLPKNKGSHFLAVFVGVVLVMSHMPVEAANSCPYMAGEYTCTVKENSKPVTWPLKVIQTQRGDETIFDFYHGSDDPNGEILHFRNIASDQGSVNTSISDPNVKIISKCAGYGVDYYLEGATSPFGTDRLDEDGNWFGCNYNENKCDVDITICIRNRVPTSP